jgi:hypothetical protein
MCNLNHHLSFTPGFSGFFSPFVSSGSPIRPRVSRVTHLAPLRSATHLNARTVGFRVSLEKEWDGVPEAGEQSFTIRNNEEIRE